VEVLGGDALSLDLPVGGLDVACLEASSWVCGRLNVSVVG
jgi:hypothetical protein